MPKQKMKDVSNSKQTETESKSTKLATVQREIAESETANKNWPLLIKLEFIKNEQNKKHAGLGVTASYLDKLRWSHKLKMWLYYYPAKASQIIANLNRRLIKGIRKRTRKDEVPETILSTAGLKLLTSGSNSFVFLTQATAKMEEKLFMTEPDEFITKFLGMQATKDDIDKFRAIQTLAKDSENRAFAAYTRLTSSVNIIDHVEYQVISPKHKEIEATEEKDEKAVVSEAIATTAMSIPSHSGDTSSLFKLAVESTAAIHSYFFREQSISAGKDSTERKSEAKQEMSSTASQQKPKSIAYTRAKRKRSESSLSELNELYLELSEHIDALNTIYTEKAYQCWNSRLQKTKKFASNLLSIIETLNIREKTKGKCYSTLELIIDALNYLPESLPKDGKGNSKIQISLQNAFEFCEGLQDIANQALNPKHNFTSLFLHDKKHDHDPKFFFDTPALDRKGPWKR